LDSSASIENRYDACWLEESFPSDDEVLSLQRWLAVCDRLACRADAGAYRAVLRGWQSWGRRYHTLAHLEACLREFDGVASLAERPAEVEMALWFHDAVYRTWGSDNEARSAAWASRVLTEGGVAADVVARIASYVLATRHAGEMLVGDAALVVDIDLSILGQGPLAFAVFERDIRREYWWVPRKKYVAGRVAILASFLKRGRIFHFDEFFLRYEQRARENLAGTIRQLERV
jgi:predicted metal-dependent HD superfamily phosphohydrolase